MSAKIGPLGIIGVALLTTVGVGYLLRSNSRDKPDNFPKWPEPKITVTLVGKGSGPIPPLKAGDKPRPAAAWLAYRVQADGASALPDGTSVTDAKGHWWPMGLFETKGAEYITIPAETPIDPGPLKCTYRRGSKVLAIWDMPPVKVAERRSIRAAPFSEAATDFPDADIRVRRANIAGSHTILRATCVQPADGSAYVANLIGSSHAVWSPSSQASVPNVYFDHLDGFEIEVAQIHHTALVKSIEVRGGKVVRQDGNLRVQIPRTSKDGLTLDFIPQSGYATVRVTWKGEPLRPKNLRGSGIQVTVHPYVPISVRPEKLQPGPIPPFVLTLELEIPTSIRKRRYWIKRSELGAESPAGW